MERVRGRYSRPQVVDGGPVTAADVWCRSCDWRATVRGEDAAAASQAATGEFFEHLQATHPGAEGKLTQKASWWEVLLVIGFLPIFGKLVLLGQSFFWWLIPFLTLLGLLALVGVRWPRYEQAVIRAWVVALLLVAPVLIALTL